MASLFPFRHTDGLVCMGDVDCQRWHTTAPPVIDGDQFFWREGTEWLTASGTMVTSPVRGDSIRHPLPSDLKKVTPRTSMLFEAETLITGDRNNQYGPPTQDFKRTADLLNAMGYARIDAEGDIADILPSDVALIIAQVKISRLMHSRGKRDSWVDLAGYAACGYECAEEESDDAS